MPGVRKHVLGVATKTPVGLIELLIVRMVFQGVLRTDIW